MGFLEDLARVAQDPEIRRLARRRAGSRELAEDALQETYLAVARLRQPETIRDLRAFFCKSLIRKINQQPARPADDLSATADHTPRHASLTTQIASSVYDEAAWHLLAGTLVRRLDQESDHLAASIPGRSSDRNRYRSAIIAAASRILALLLEGHVSPADWNAILRQEYPQWCEEPGLSRDTMDQRFSRARCDVQFLLKQLVARDDLNQ